MSAYEIKVSVTPLCSSCGAELGGGFTEARATDHPFDRDNPLERTERRVFFPPCDKCFVFRPDVAELVAAARRVEDDNHGHGFTTPSTMDALSAALSKFQEGA